MVALDPQTGAILAMVSHPTYDPNDLASHDLSEVDKNYNALNKDPDKPLLNRTIDELYPPGSVFKVVTAAAALSTGEYTENSMLPGPAVLDLPDTSADLPNHDGGACGPTERDHDDAGAGDLVQHGVRLRSGWSSAPTRCRSQAAKFGFGDVLEVPMRVTPSSVPAELNKPQLAQSSIGQYDVRVTPLQMAMVAAGVANRGVVMTPYLVESVIGSDLSVIESRRPAGALAGGDPRGRRAADPDDGGRRRGRHRHGAPRSTGVDVAGKTGTAQHGEGRKAARLVHLVRPGRRPEDRCRGHRRGRRRRGQRGRRRHRRRPDRQADDGSRC